ncbi:MAG: cation:proton antiporter, partial [Acidimicrobiales bacterium]
VADDVLGLVILTVVVRLVTEGSIGIGIIAETVGMAVVFLVATTAAGLTLAPRLFSGMRRISRSPGTLVAAALAFTLAFAELAQLARLAPIIGAFVAGLALGRGREGERISRELKPVGHLFIPVFFLQIGIDADLAAMAKPAVLAIAGVLLVAAVVGKLAAVVGMVGSPGDRWLVGLGMLPRGEVGLIFAGIGLREGVLGGNLYAALLLVVLATTLVTPPLLRARLQAVRQRRASPAARPTPAGGWLVVDDGVVTLQAVPPDFVALHVALQAAQLVTTARPGPALLDWLGALGDVPLRWDKAATDELLSLLRSGSTRSWRLLDTSGVLERALPELAIIVRHRQDDPFELDTSRSLRWALVERLHELTVEGGDQLAAAEHEHLDHPDWLLLAALLVDTAGDAPEEPVAAARRLVMRLGLGAGAEEEVALLVGEHRLLTAAVRRPDGLAEEHVLRIATHLDKPERARALYLLSVAMGDLEPWERERLDRLNELIQRALARPDLTGLEARNLVEARRQAALRLLGDSPAAPALAEAPRSWIVTNDPAGLARQAVLVAGHLGAHDVRVMVGKASRPAERRHPGPSGPPAEAQPLDGLFRLEVSATDSPGLLARSAGALAGAGLDVVEAGAAVWGSRRAVQSFLLRSPGQPDPVDLQSRLAGALSSPTPAAFAPDASLTWDDESSPWATVCTIEAPDRHGLLAAFSAAFAMAGAQVQSARVTTTAEGIARDLFEVTNRSGEKLSENDKDRVAAALAGNTSGGFRHRRPWARQALRRVEPAPET